MCARYSLTKDHITITIGEYEIVIAIKARYNIAPSQKAPVIVQTPTGYAVKEMSWGWKPVWSNQLLINAQSETILSKPTFKKHIANRCLIPADGFYEWTADKIPIRFTRQDDNAFCFAGLFYESTTQPFDVPITEQHFIVLTTTPNETVGKVHNRMPLIVKNGHYDWWFNSMFETVINFPSREEFNYCPVQRALNKAGNEGSELIRPSLRQSELL